MKRNILSGIAFAALLLIMVSSCSNIPAVKGSKNYVQKQFKVENFTGIELLGSSNISYFQDSKPHVDIYGSDNILELLEVKVDNGILKIDFKKNTNIINMGKLEIKVYSSEINNLILKGSGDIIVENGLRSNGNLQAVVNGSGSIKADVINCEELAVSVHGSGDIKARQADCKSCMADIYGSGNIMLSGKTSNAQYRISGSGTINAENLKAADVEAIITGSGNIRCFADGKLSGKMTGSGDISYTGNPKEINFPNKRLHKIN